MAETLELKDGISVVVPSYKSEKHVKKLLNSLKQQSLDNKLFETIFIINGEEDGTPNMIRDFQENNPEMNIVLTRSEKGASNARNKGILEAQRKYTTFIDDDDYISPSYLEKFLEHAEPNRIVIGNFLDVDEDSGEIKESYMAEALKDKKGEIEDPYNEIASVLVMMTNKLIPTEYVKDNLFNTELTSGEDLVYYASLYVKNDFKFYMLDKEEEAIYYRLLRSNSISRQDTSYKFNVDDRLNVINELNASLKVAENEDIHLLIRNTIISQILFINKYLKENPNDLKKVLKDIGEYELEYFPYKYLNEDDIKKFEEPNNELVISYSFPPTSATASNVLAKRILKNKRKVSILVGTLFDQPTDYSLFEIVSEFIHEGNYVDIENFYFYLDGTKFVNEGFKILNEIPTYDKIYSRTQFVPSHLLGYFYKATHDTFWTAEFSDPMIRALDGEYMSSPINNEELVERINKYLPEGADTVKNTDTVNEIIQYVTFLMADEIIFTNENQKAIMLEDFPKIKKIVENKSKVIPHPTLEEKYYYIKQSDYEVDENYINFAYFGFLYKKRNFEEFIAGFTNLNKEFKDKFRLHIFTPTKTAFENIMPPELLEKTIINESVDYLEFLNLTTKMDVLLAEDAKTDHLYDINPFLPSKISDYKGSGRDIWAICEKGSIMDGMDEIKYKSYLNDLNSSKITINKIMSDKLGIETEITELKQEDIDKYYQGKYNYLIDNVIDLSSIKDQFDIEQKKYVAKVQEYENEIQENNARIQEYKDYTNYLRKWMRPRFVFKIIKKIRSIYRKLKS